MKGVLTNIWTPTIYTDDPCPFQNKRKLCLFLNQKKTLSRRCLQVEKAKILSWMARWPNAFAGDVDSLVILQTMQCAIYSNGNACFPWIRITPSRQWRTD